MATTKKTGLGRGLGALLQGIDVAAPVKTRPVPPVNEPAEKPVARQQDTMDSRPAAPKGDTAGITAHSVAGRRSTSLSDMAGAAEDEFTINEDSVVNIPVDDINRGIYQPRMNFDPEALQELADSITAQGLIQPILVRQRGAAYELIAGERRWRAAQLAGLTEIPAIVRDLDDTATAAVTLIENIQREDLNALEEARALHRLKSEFGMNDSAVAEAVGRSRTAVTNLIRLLDLDERVAEMLTSGKIDMGHARAILTLPPDDQHMLAMRVYAEGLTVRAVEALVREGISKKRGKRKPKGLAQEPHIKALQSQLSDKLGAKVGIDHKANGKGSIVINYNSLDELDGILSHIS